MKNKILALLLIAVLLTGCSSETASSPVQSSTPATDTAGSLSQASDETAGEEPFDADKVRELLKAETYVMNFSVSLQGSGYVSVENPTAYNLTLTCDMVLKDVNGNIIAERSQTLNHVRPHSNTVFYVSEMGEYESDHPEAGSVEYTFTDISETVDHECPLANLEIKDYIDDNKCIILEVKNTGSEEVTERVSFLFLSFYEEELSDRMIDKAARYLEAGGSFVSDPMRGGNPVESYLGFYFCDDIMNYK